MNDPETIPLAYAVPRSRARPPTALKIVARLTVIGGVMSILDVIVKLMHGQIFIDLGVLGVFMGPGLLRGSRGWRTCALVFLWFAMIFGAVFAVITGLGVLRGKAHMNVDFFGIPTGSAPMIVGFLVNGIFLALVVWEYRVLVRDDVRRYFGLPSWDD